MVSRSKCTCDFTITENEYDLSTYLCSMEGYDLEGQLDPKGFPTQIQLSSSRPTSEQREPAIPQAAPIPDESAYQRQQELYDQGIVACRRFLTHSFICSPIIVNWEWSSTCLIRRSLQGKVPELLGNATSCESPRTRR